MKNFTSAQALINNEIQQLFDFSKFEMEGSKRIEIYTALGNSNSKRATEHKDSRPVLSVADYVRAYIELITAKKVEPLWQSACLETEMRVRDDRELSEIHQEEEIYLAQRKQKHIEHISVYDVPRAFIPSHILEMTELALTGKIHDHEAFYRESNELWQIYPRPEQMEREFYIKWAAQEALYAAIGWLRYNPEPPAEYASLAFAGIFESEDFDNRRCIMDKNKQREFWLWWLSEAIPQAFSKVEVS
jgi:hypothetical protein